MTDPSAPGTFGARRMALVYAAIAAATHLLITLLRVVPVWSDSDLITGDTSTYILSARNLVDVGEFSRESGPPYLWEPYRTPGYPLVLAASIIVFGDHRLAVFLTVLTAAAAAYCGVRLAQHWGASTRASHIAGLFIALLPNSLAYSAFLFTDGMFAHLFVVWAYALILALTEGRWGAWVLCAALTAYLQLLRPSFNMAVIFVAVGGLLWARGPARIGGCVALCAVCFATPTWLDSKVRTDHGETGLHVMHGLREYLQGRHLAQQSGRGWNEVVGEINAADKAEARREEGPGSFDARLYRVRKRHFMEFARSNPGTVIRLVIEESAKQFIAPQEVFYRALRWGPQRPWRLFGTLVTGVMWGVVLFGAWRMRRAGQLRPVLWLSLVVAGFVASSGLVTAAGGRLRLPADLAVAPLFGIGAARLASRREEISRG